jgi:DNA modification methylase
MKRNEIFCGDWKEAAKTLDPGTIDCIITSPPYYGLRDYGHAGQLGQEQTPEAYINSLVEGFRLLRPALKDTGTLWVNIGDSYASDGKWGGTTGGKHVNGLHGETGIGRGKKITGLKAKDLIGIPWMLAFALRADGWYLRQDIIWNKPNPMPESVQDRCTKSHEYIFLLSKSERYYFDNEAIKEGAVWADSGRKSKKRMEFNGKTNALEGREAFRAITQTRNKRSVWTVTTKPFSGAHFACYPHELIDPCIMAGTSEKGCCPKCGGPWSRILEPVLKVEHTGETETIYPEGTTANRLAMLRQAAREQGTEYTGEKKTIGWAPSCKCGITETVPAIVYDPFMGSGTTASAAASLGRHFMGSELNPEYLQIQSGRLNDELGLFNPANH